MKKLLHELADYKQTTWKPVVKDGDGKISDSKFGGLPMIHKNASWPRCPNCNQHMQLFVQINLNDVETDEFGNGIVQLFYCITTDQRGFPLCESEQDGWEAFSKNAAFRYIPANKFISDNNKEEALCDYFPPKIIVGWEAFEDYPGWQEQDDLGLELSEQEQRILSEAGYPLDGDKFSGWPHWIQALDYPDCPKCRKRMQLFFQIDFADDHLPWGNDSICGQITQCPDHKEVLAFQWAGT